jgi:tryptophanyl-tRNA synthetase
MRAMYLRGGFGYGEVKQALFEVLEQKFGPARVRYDEYVKDRAYLERMLLDGAEKARSMGAPLMRKARKAIGVRYQR